jgi:hypothetical protein
MRRRCAAAVWLAVCGWQAASGQTRECPGDFRSAAPWLEGYHHAQAPPPEPMKRTDPIIRELEDLQTAALRVAREARLAGDFGTAAEALRQAQENAALMAGLRARGAAQAAGMAPVFLLAFTDETIRAAAAWWVDGDILHYVTPGGKQAQAPLAALDRALTERLNRERNLELRLPPAR